MALNDMIQQLLLEVPGIASSQAQKYINEALGLIYDTQMWSWQLQTSGWLTPGLLFPVGPGNSAGTVTVTPFSDQVIGDAVASAAWAAHSGRPLLTECQFRSPYYSLYNIIGYSTLPGGYGSGGYGAGGYGGGSGSGVLKLDRPWMEPADSSSSYMIYQAYFPVPVPDFKRFLSARDTTNNWPMDFWTKSQKDLMYEDPERTIFNDPNYFVPQQQDQRPGSATLGNMLYELWPHPLNQLPYTFMYLRRGPLLVKPTDTVPYPLTEEVVKWRAIEVACLYKERQKGEDMQRGMGADWKFSGEAAQEEYKKLLKPVKDRDDDLVDLYMAKYRPDYFNQGEPFATTTGGLNIGRF